MAKLTDIDPMPIGKFKGEKMENVPYWHLLWFAEQSYCPAVPSNSKTRELYDELLERESDEREQFQTELKRYVEDDL